MVSSVKDKTSQTSHLQIIKRDIQKPKMTFIICIISSYGNRGNFGREILNQIKSTNASCPCPAVLSLCNAGLARMLVMIISGLFLPRCPSVV